MTLSFIEAMGPVGPTAGWLFIAEAGDPGSFAKVYSFLVSGGFFMIFIAICSLIALSVVIHRVLFLRKLNVVPAELEAELLELERRFADGQTERLGQLLAVDESALARVARIVLSGEHELREEASSSAEAGAREELVKLQSGIAALEVVITIAPLLGLLGTVSGLVSVFGTLGGSGAELTDPAQVARGIAEALNTTIAGLAVAVPTVIAHSYLTNKIERFAVRIEVLTNIALAVCYRGAVQPSLKAPSEPAENAQDDLLEVQGSPATDQS